MTEPWGSVGGDYTRGECGSHGSLKVTNVTFYLNFITSGLSFCVPPPPPIHTFNPNAQCDGIGGGAFGKYLGHDSKALQMGLVLLQKRPPRAP